MVDYISELPEEVLVKIFHEAYPVIDCNRPCGSTRDLETVSKVCKEWNGIVRTYGTLWSTIHLHLAPYYPGSDSLPSRLDLAHLAIKRSGQVPLRVKCTATDHENTRKYEKAFEIVFSAADRWQEVHLDGLLLTKMVAGDPRRWRNSTRPMPLLTKLSLSRANHCDSLLGTFMGLTQGNLPRLSHVHLERYTGIGSFAGSLTSKGFPWNQITHLELVEGQFNGFSEVGSIDDFFRQVPRLVNLTMQPLRYFPRRKKPPPLLNHLETFIFSLEFGNGSTKDTWASTLSFLNAPNLTTLSIEADSVDNPLLSACLPPFLETSHCLVKRLSLINLSQEGYSILLPLLPSVEYLFLHSPNSQLHLELLVGTSSSTPLPSLVALSLIWDSKPISNCIAAIVASRKADCTTCTPLKAVDIACSSPRQMLQLKNEMDALGPLWANHSVKGELWTLWPVYRAGSQYPVTNWFPAVR